MRWIIGLLQRKYVAFRAARDAIHQNDLHEAIRIHDPKSAAQSLKKGATLSCCTLGPDGYYTPAELAIAHKSTKVLNMAQSLGSQD